jgi:hypothetical protein
MKTDHGWIAPPPSYPPILPQACNLQQYIDMENNKSSDIFGTVYTQGAFIEKFLNSHNK